MAIVRIEQLYPLNAPVLTEVLGRYPASAQRYWVQEEPRNAGAYLFIDDLVRNSLHLPGLAYIGRDRCATPAVGDTHMSDQQQEAIVSAAVGAKPGSPAEGHAPTNGHKPNGHAPAGAVPQVKTALAPAKKAASKK